MKRVNFYLLSRQVEALKRLSRSSGVPVSELIRRALDEYLDGGKSKPADKGVSK